jgi:hypothetical protein
VGGGRQLRWQPKPSPLPQDAESPAKRRIWAKVVISPRGGWSLKSLKVAKGGHVTSAGVGIKIRQFPANSLMNGCSKKPFYQSRGGELLSTLLQCQSLPTSFIRAVRTIKPPIALKASIMKPVIFFLYLYTL